MQSAQSPRRHSAQNSLSGTLSASASPTPEFTVRPPLPDRDVTAETIEDAYIRFIFYCNPAVPLASDTAALREAFRNPPKSGGKIFDSFAIFELVKQFYAKEIKTWTELTTKLGVEPPDPSKDESTQKVAQYGVRLKKWMNSLHVKAFFEYLMNMPNDYWTKVPNDANPTGQAIRDGVAVEDDMALRALLPHIRPKRGRKRPGENHTLNTPISRTHLAPQSAIDGFRQAEYRPWAGHVEGSRGTPWQDSDVQTPVARWPQSALTPTVARGSLWNDIPEPQSAITPSRPKQRRGPKNVSSAWRPGAVEGGGRTRGRPPINRTTTDNSPSNLQPGSFPIISWGVNDPTSSPAPQSSPVPHPPMSQGPSFQQPVPGPFQVPVPIPQRQPVLDGSRPARPSISLQVPERQSGPVRLATAPPPIVMINGEANGNSEQDASAAPHQADQLDQPSAFTHPLHPKNTMSSPLPQPRHVPQYFFENEEDRTNMDGIMGYLARCTEEAEWTDADGNIIHNPPIEETNALVNTTVEAMWKGTPSPEAFLINLAAMAGGYMLLSDKSKVRRLGTEGGFLKYRCEWQYRFGSIKGFYTMEQGVPVNMAQGREKFDGKVSEEEEKNLTAEQWQQKYHEMIGELRKKDRELLDIRSRLYR